jgi:hypothetical protein
MPYTLSYENASGCIVVTVTGKLDLPLLQSLASDVSEIMQKREHICILNDLRQATPAEGALDIYQMPDLVKKSGVHHSCKRAIVVGDKTSEFYFLETMFINRGHQVKMFANMDDAKNWLFKKGR